MNNKYDDMSDLEVCEAVLMSKCDGVKIIRNEKSAIYYTRKNCQSVFVFDCCNKNSTDAFKLMIDNEMKLEKIEQWRASSWAIDNSIVSYSHENPCRAIAICYLMMKNAEKDNG